MNNAHNTTNIRGVVVTTGLTAGQTGIGLNHAEGIVSRQDGIVVATGLVAGSKKIFIGGIS